MYWPSGLANVPPPRPHTLRHRTPPQPVPLILKHGTYIKREKKKVRFFCSHKLNGNSGFAVNGDGLLYAREPCPLEADFQNTNGRGDVRSVYSSTTVDGQSMCIALSLASTHRIAVLRGVSE